MNRSMQAVIGTLSKIRSSGSFSGLKNSTLNYIHQKKASEHYGSANFPDEIEKNRQRQEANNFKLRPLISILVPLYNTPEKYLTQMLQSVFDQTYDNWELCLADGSDIAHDNCAEIIDDYCRKRNLPTKKIHYKRLAKNLGISENSNACIEMANGEYLAPFDHDDLLHPSVLYLYVKEINARQADYLYCDEATFTNDDLNSLVTIHFKPDYARDNLRANNYICHLSCFRRDLLGDDIRYRSEYDGSQDHDLILRVTKRAQRIVHVPKVLYYWRSHAGSTASALDEKGYAIDAARHAVEDSLRQDGFTNFSVRSSRAAQNIFQIRYEIQGHPLISIIIREKTEKWRKAVRKMTAYDNCEFVNKFEDAKGEFLVFLSPGLIPKNNGWIEELLMYAQRADVGAVGGEIVCHQQVYGTGIILGNGKEHIAASFYRGWPVSGVGYMGRLCYAQDISAVSADCMMIARNKYCTAGGFDKAYHKSYFDLDICLRMRKMGYWNVFNPYAVMNIRERRAYNKESPSEMRNEDDKKILLSRWKMLIERGDPFYNPNFTSDSGIIAYR